jgi:hypothetical protein
MLRSLFQVAGEDRGQSLKWCLFLHVTFALRPLIFERPVHACFDADSVMFWTLTAELGFQHLKIVPCRLASCMRVLENWVRIPGSQTYKVGSELKVSINETFPIGWAQSFGIYFDLPCRLPLLAVRQDKLVMTRHSRILCLRITCVHDPS